MHDSLRSRLPRLLGISGGPRHTHGVAKSHRSTIYLAADVHRALRRRAAQIDQPMSAVVNDALRRALSEDASDLAVARRRRSERAVSFASVVRGLKRRGAL